MTNRNQILLLAVLVAAIAGFMFWNTRTAPLREELTYLKEDHETAQYEAEIRVRDGQRAERQYEQLRVKVEEAEAHYRSILDTVPTRRDVGGLLDEINTIAARSGATLTEVTPSDSEQNFSDDIRYITTDVTITGNYAQTIEFLTGLENLNRFADISETNITRRNDDWRDPTLNTSLKLRIYLYRGAR